MHTQFSKQMFASFARRTVPRVRAFAAAANPRVFFDIAIAQKPAGRITFEVRFAVVAPPS